MTKPRLSLWCQEGGSDKTYTLWVEKEGNGYWLKFLYGPRGGTQKPGTKNKAAFTIEKAEAEYDKLLKEKLAKGYKPMGENVPEYLEVKEAKDAGVRPMLLTPDAEENLEEYIKSDDWCAQEKMNGKRIMIQSAPNGRIVGVNRRGLECPIPLAVEKAFNGVLVEGSVLDGEMIGETYYVFDVISLPKGDRRILDGSYNYTARLNVIDAIVKGVGRPNVRFVPAYVGKDNKRKFVRGLQDGRKEGVVFKRMDASYEPGRRENLAKAIAVKVKFYAEVNARVIDWTDKQSIEVALLDGQKLVSVGKVTVPDKYVKQIKAGSIVRVKYLYATPGAKQLYQAHLDPTDDGSVIADAEKADKITSLKFEGKEEE